MTARAEYPIRFAKRVFWWAGIYGLIVMIPCYGVELVGTPPFDIGEPAIFYGFVGVVLAFQVLMFVIAGDPLRYRPAMLAACLDKLAFGVPGLTFSLTGRGSASFVPFSLIDLLWFALFAAAWWRLKQPDSLTRS